MRNLKIITLFVILLSVLSCNSKSVTKDQQSLVSEVTNVASNSDKIEAYYFHFTIRCETCKTIEANTKQNLETLYPEYVKQGLITFQSLNLDDASVRQIAEKLGITSQALIFTKGDQKINLTNEGFLYAVAKPEKFREIINEKVGFLLTR